jgi:chromosome partitioning protein
MHQSKTAAFLNQKGGVGKTTSVVNVGAGLAILGKRVLIVDLDPQGHLTSFLGVDPREYKRSVYDILLGEIQAGDAVITKDLSARLYIDDRESQLSLSVIPSSPDLADAELALSNAANREFLLKRALAETIDEFDYIIFDCPPSLGLISINALAASQKVFVPVQTEYLALESLESLTAKIRLVTAELQLDLVIGGLIATRFDGRKILSRTVVDTLRERYGALLLQTVIRENIALAESPRFGKDIFSYRARSYGAEDYLNLALEIMGRIATADQLFSVERGVIRGSVGDQVAV